MHPAWSLDSMSAYSMKDRPAKFGSLAVSFPTLRRITDYKSIKGIPIDSVYVKFKSSAS